MGSESSILLREPLNDIDDFKLTSIFFVSNLLVRRTTVICFYFGDVFWMA